MTFRKQKDLFLHIWNTKPHTCELCGAYLGEEPLAFHFSHILSKGAYPRIKTHEDNIMLNCMSCHHEWDFGSPEGLPYYEEISKRKQELKFKYNTNQI